MLCSFQKCGVLLIGVVVCLSSFVLHKTDDQILGLHLKGKAKSVKIPIEIYHNLILLPIRINGSFEMKFILDTGVNTTVLTEPLLTQLIDFKHLRDIKIVGLGEGEPINAKIAAGIQMSLPNGISGKGMSVVILPNGTLSFSEMFGQPIYGLIGYDVFSSFVVEINYAQKYLRLHKPNKYKPKCKGRNCQKLPIVLENTKPFVYANITEKNQQQHRLKLLLDTGATQAITLWYNDLHIPISNINAYLGQGLNGDIYGNLARVSQLNLQAFQFADVIAAYPDSSSINILLSSKLGDGHIGAEIFKRFTTIFDYSRNSLILKKNRQYNEAFTYNSCGLEVIGTGLRFKDYEIANIRAKSPAAQADIQIGDKLLTINGVNTEKMDMGEVYFNLNRKKTGKKVCLKLLRAGEKIKTCFVMYREI